MTAAIKATREVVTDYWQLFLHGAVHAAAPGNRAALLFPANEARELEI
jgi:hypothetical protein